MKHSITFGLLALCGMSAAPAAETAPQIPLVAGLVMVSVGNTPEGDRENVITIEEVSSVGVRYSWRLNEPTPGGQRRRLDFARQVNATDLVAADALHTVFSTVDHGPQPGTTSMVLSQALYDSLMKSGSAPMSLTFLEVEQGVPLTLRGTAVLQGRTTAPFAVLVNGRRVDLPSVRVQLELRGAGKLYTNGFWILANPKHPLILRMDRPGGYRTQTVRIDLPAAAAGPARIGETLASECRAELPGVYFDFASAEIDERSRAALQNLAAVLTGHPDWVIEVEGHTDDIGQESANLALSTARAGAVRRFLIDRHRVPATRLISRGYGESRPRETNATFEGRARNRRVEVTRRCDE